ncbi:MerR family transcriptional regulator [Methylomonas methanica]|uniref:MerR family transcriptional regulator n=2 Tax=Methylomonas TaxID=416 RepID=A0A126T4A0_9GAMM|nr:MerR family transcriptional regulator [Methylomonas denitrificans]OAH97549.1 MerR family transcriptional regulator [Methylomonas methanica]
MRVARDNGYDTLCRLGKTFGSVDGLCRALGLTTEERQILFGPYPSFWGPSVLSNGLMAADFNHSQLRWCPLCLGESAHLRGSWLLKISCVCNRHATWLQEKCPDCGSFQRLDKVNFEICGCGASLAEIRAARPVADSVYHLSQTVEASIIGNSALLGFPPLSLPEWLKLISYLGQFSETCRPRKPGKIANMHQLDTASAFLLQASYLLDSWPENFRALLAAIQCQAESEAKTKTSIRGTFGTLYHVLYTDLSAPCFQFLRDEFERFLHVHWPGVVNKRHRAFKPETVATHPRVTLKQAAKKAGIAPSTVRHFVRAELIAGNQTELPSGRKMRSVDEQSLAQIAVLAKECVTLGETAKQLVLPECRVRELISDGILKPLVSRMHGNAAAWLIPKQQVRALIFAGTGVTHSPPIINVRYILKYWHLREGEFITLVRALLERQLEPVGKSTESVPIGNICLDEQVARKWLVEKRYVGGASISVDEAAKRLGLKQQVVYDLVKLGLLATSQDDLPGRRVTQTSLEEFQATYISLAEFAVTLNRAPRWLLQTLSVQPVSGPMIDGSRQYFFRRVDLSI